MENYNPYQAPQNEMEVYQDPDELILLDTPDSLSIGAGASWVGEAWRIFMARPLLWLGASFIFWAILMTAGAIPILGNILFIMLLVGMSYMTYLIQENQDIEIGDLFIAFREKAGSLVWLFFAQFLFLSILISPLIILFLMAITNWQGGNTDNPSPINLMLALLFLALSFCVCGAVVWFSHLLVFFNDLRSFDAMKYSIKITFKNLLPFTLYGFIISIIWLLAVFTLGLGFLVTLPLTVISTFVAYRQIATVY